jgi:hypothetical protein
MRRNIKHTAVFGLSLTARLRCRKLPVLLWGFCLNEFHSRVPQPQSQQHLFPIESPHLPPAGVRARLSRRAHYYSLRGRASGVSECRGCKTSTCPLENIINAARTLSFSLSRAAAAALFGHMHCRDWFCSIAHGGCEQKIYFISRRCLLICIRAASLDISCHLRYREISNTIHVLISVCWTERIVIFKLVFCLLSWKMLNFWFQIIAYMKKLRSTEFGIMCCPKKALFYKLQNRIC